MLVSMLLQQHVGMGFPGLTGVSVWLQICFSQLGMAMPTVIPILGKQRQEDCCKFEAVLGCIARPLINKPKQGQNLSVCISEAE